MTQANDIAGLFKKLGTSPDLYQELVRQNEVQKSRERWPLLSAIQANEPAPPPVGIRREAVRQAPPQASSHPQPAHYPPAAPAPASSHPPGYPVGVQYDPAPQQPQMAFAPQPVPQPMPQGFAPQPFSAPGSGSNAGHFHAPQPHHAPVAAPPFPPAAVPPYHPQSHAPVAPPPYAPAPAHPYLAPDPAAMAQHYPAPAPAPASPPHYPAAPSSHPAAAQPQQPPYPFGPHPGQFGQAGTAPAHVPTAVREEPALRFAPNAAPVSAAPAAGAVFQAPSAPGSHEAGHPTQLTSLFDRLAKPEAPAAPVAEPRKQSIFQRLIR